MKNFKILMVITVGLLFASMVFSGQEKVVDNNEKKVEGGGAVSVKSQKARIPEVGAVKVEKAVMSTIFNTTGNIIADNKVVIKSTVEGPISYCPWQEGDFVEANQKLIEINRPVYIQEVQQAETALRVARARLSDMEAGTRPELIAQARELVRQKEQAVKFAEADFQRIEALVENSSLPAEDAEKSRVDYVKWSTELAVAREKLNMLVAGATETELEIQRSLVAEAEAKLGFAKAKYQECIIEAPFSGIVSQVHVRQGDLATPRVALIEIYDPSSIVVRFAVAETLSVKVKKGMVLKVCLDAYENQSYEAVVSKIYPGLVIDSRSRLVEAKLKNAPDLLPGMFARIAAEFDSTESVVIPDGTILSTVRGERIVYVIKDQRVKSRVIKTGVEKDNRVQILSGLEAGEMVVLEGNRMVKDGMKVKIMAQSESAKSLK
jgi:membrane fusion protein (multidrug efflux system)